MLSRQRPNRQLIGRQKVKDTIKLQSLQIREYSTKLNTVELVKLGNFNDKLN